MQSTTKKMKNERIDMKNINRRHFFTYLGTAGLANSGAAFGKGLFAMSKKITVDVIVFNYLNRPIFDVYLNKIRVGGSASVSDTPYGKMSTVVGVRIPEGPQTLTWRIDGPIGMKDNGEKFSARNSLNVDLSDLQQNAGTLAAHIYPDNTAELVFSRVLVEQTARGLSYAKKYQKYGK
jgi:hypothetical protein